MSDFETTGSLRVELEEKSVKDARSTIEEELSADPITVEAETSGRPGSAMDGLRSDGGMGAGIASGLESQASDLDSIASAWDENIPLNERRNYLLEELVELTEEGNAQGGRGGGVGGMLAGGAIAGGLALGLGVSKLIGFLGSFDWPEIDPPEINVPSEIPVGAPSSIPVDAPSSIPVDIPDPLSVIEPDWNPLSVLKPGWVPIPVKVPDPLAVDVPDPLPVDVPGSIPVDAPDSIPIEAPSLTDWLPDGSGSGSGTGTESGSSSGEVTSITDKIGESGLPGSEMASEHPFLTGLAIPAGGGLLGGGIASGGAAGAASGLAKATVGGGALAALTGAAGADSGGGPVTASQDVYGDGPEVKSATSTSAVEARGSDGGGSNAASERRSSTTIEHNPTYEIDTRRLERTIKKDLRKFQRKLDEMEREFRDAT